MSDAKRAIIEEAFRGDRTMFSFKAFNEYS